MFDFEQKKNTFNLFCIIVPRDEHYFDEIPLSQRQSVFWSYVLVSSKFVDFLPRESEEIFS